MQSPEICQEIFGQIAQNFADLNGGACAQEAADAVKGALNTGAKIARAAMFLPFARRLIPTDFGAKAVFKTLEGSLRIDGNIATVAVENMEGNLGHYRGAINALAATARSNGATTLRIEATIANPDLLRAMERIFGPASQGVAGGAQDVWSIPL